MIFANSTINALEFTGFVPFETMMKVRLSIFSFFLSFGLVESARAEEGTLEKKLAPKVDEIVAWAASPEIVNAVVAQNRASAVSNSAMNEKKWLGLEPRDPFVISFTTNAAAKFLRTKNSQVVTEAFLNDASGYKVAFAAKPTHWKHAGNPKHEQPMMGKIWRGPIEFDQSSRTKQIQIAVPVLDQGKPVGSLVIGINIFELARE